MKKRLLATLCLTAMLAPSAVYAADFNVDGVYYNIISLARKTCEVTKKGGELYYSGNVVVPAKVTDPTDNTEYDVVAVGESAFFYSPDLSSVTLPNSIVEIKKSAFSSSGLTSIVIPSSVTTIGEDAFYGTNCTSFTVPGNVKTVGKRAFYLNHSLTSITFEEGVESLDVKAVGANKLLTEINLPSSLTTIGDQAFYDNEALTDFTIPAGVTTMGAGVFSECSNLVNINVAEGNTSYGSVDGVLFDADLATLMEYPVGRTATSYEVPAGTVTINDRVFEGNTRITSVTFPGSLRTIGKNCFNKASNLVSVTFSEGLEEVGEFAFAQTTKVTSFVFPKSLKRIGQMAFSHHSAMTEITLPGVVSLGDYAFFGVEKATTVTLGPSLTNMAKQVFQRCYAITTVNIGSVVPPVCEGSTYDPGCKQFQDDVYTKATLHVPAGSKSAYEAAPGWMQFTSIVDDLEVPSDPEIPVETIYIMSMRGNPEANQNVGTNYSLWAMVMPDNATNKEVTWSSSNENVATVTAQGDVSFLAAGEVTITATSVSTPAVSDSFTFIVTAPKEFAFVITPGAGEVERLDSITILGVDNMEFGVYSYTDAVTLTKDGVQIASYDSEALAAFDMFDFFAENPVYGYQITGLNLTAAGTYVLTIPDGMFAYAEGYDYVEAAGVTVTWTIVSSGIGSIKVERAGKVEYFNMQGVRVDNPASGIYIRRQDGKSSKVMIK